MMVKLANQKKMGATSTYTEELANEICEQIATNALGLEDLCEINKHWPSPTTIFKWRVQIDSFAEKYMRAKSCQVESLVDRALKLSRSREYKYEDDEGNIHNDPCFVPANRLEIDTIKWFACKLAPKIYGDKIQNEVTVKSHEDALKELK